MSRVAVVTGGASGVGRSICEHLAAHGHRVAVLDLAGETAEAVAAGIRQEGYQAFGAQVDVADRASVERAYDQVRSEFGPIEIVVTSAAVTGYVPFDQITLEDWNRIIAVNLTGTFHSVQAAIGDMADAGWGAGRHDLFGRRAERLASPGALLGLQSRRNRADQDARRGVRGQRHHGQHNPAVHRRHPVAAGRPESRDGGRLRGPRARHSGRPPWHGRRHRRNVLVPVLGGRELHHRAGNRRQRRCTHLTGPRQRITGFVEECLRIDAPVNVDFRLAKRDTTVAGVHIAPGTPVMILPGAANRDPRRFESPEEFRLQRPNALQHIAFGKGIHTCPGAPLARAEAQIMIERFVDRTRNIKISAKHHGPPNARRFDYEPALSRRALHALHIEFESAASD